MPALAEAFVRIRADLSGVRRETEDQFDESGRRSGQRFGDGFSRDATGRLRDARGRFTRELENGPPIRLPRPDLPSPAPVRAKVDVDVDAAKTAIAGLFTDLSRLAAIPIGATLAVGIGALGGAFAAAAAGAGGLAAVALPSLTKIKEATAAQTKEEQASTGAGAAAQAQAFALAGARQQLSAALRNSGYAHAQALEGVKRAERDLTDAQRTAVDVERQLGRARQDAQRQLQDMANQVASTRLAVRQSQLDISQAQADYNKILADPSATKAQKEQAQLAVEQAKQRLKEQQLALQRLEQDEKKASKAGVEGSDQVRNARDRLAEANRKVADTERALAKARADVSRTDRASADAVASARRALAQASAAPQGSGPSPADLLLAQLTPDERKLKANTDRLSATWKSWQESMQPTVLPLVSKGIKILEGQIPSLTPIVKGAADAVGGLLDRVARAAKSPEFQQFKDQFAKLVPTSITGLGNIIGDLVTGFGRLFQAFLPYAPQAIGFMEQLAQKFADFAKQQTTGGEDTGLSKFFAFVRDNGPLVSQTLQDAARAIGYVVTSIAPIAGALGLGALSTFGLLAKAILLLSPGQIQALAVAFVGFRTALAGYKIINTAVDGIQAFRAAMLAAQAGNGPLWARALNSVWTGMKNLATGAKDAVVSLWNYVRAQAASAAASLRAKAAAAGTWIADQARALGTLVASMWASVRAQTAAAVAAVRQRVATVAGTAVQLAAAAASRVWAAGQWLLNAALDANPIGLVIIGIAALVAAVILAYRHSETFRNIVQAAWAGIQAAVSAAWSFIQPIFAAIGQWITGTLAPLFTRLWTGVVQPAFQGIGNIISTVWTGIIQPALQALWAFISNVLAPVIRWLWNTVVAPGFQAIGQIIAIAWNNVIRPVLTALWAFIQNVLAPVITWLWRTIIAPAFQAIGLLISVAWNTVIKPVLTALWTFVQKTLGPIFTWLWNTIIKPAWDGISALISFGWNNVIKPVFELLMKGVKAISDSFGAAVGIIKTAWDKIQDVAKAPVNFIIGTVYNKGIRGLWNTVIDWLKLPGGLKLGEIPQLAKGGTLANPAAATPMMTNGPMAIVGEGNPNHPEYVIPTDPKYRGRARAMMVSAARRMNMQVLAPGGILGLGGDPWDSIKKFAGDVADLTGDALDLIANPKAVWDKLVGKMVPSTAGLDGPWPSAIGAIPKKMLGEMWGVAEKIIKAFGDGYGGKGVEGALKWARKQVGKPYLWGGAGPGGYDCSGFQSALVNVIRGDKNPYHRLFSTDSFNATGGPGFARNAKSAYTVGVTHAGVGHMAGTLNGVNVESSGGVGVRVGGGARGTGDGLFPYKYGYKFDRGGLLPPGPINHTSRPEPVLTTRQWTALLTLAERGATARTGPLIDHATIHEDSDVDRLAQRLKFYENSGSF